MFDNIFAAIEKWMRELLSGMVESNLSTMFTAVNQQTSEIAAQVGQTPQGWNSSIFSMIRNISDSVVIPIAGIIITLILCYELISMLTERNNLHDVDTWMFFKYFVKMWIAVYLVSHTFDIAMAVFDIGQSVVNSSSGIIRGNTAIDISSLSMQMQAAMATMAIGELVTLALETLVVSWCLKILSVVITVIMYGRMIEIYLYTSLAPIPFATMSNREWGHVGTNYFRGLFALAFQAFLMMVCVAIYSKTVRFYDINYQLAQNEDKNTIFESWCDFLNYFDASIRFQLSFINHKSDMSEYNKVIQIEPQHDQFDDVRIKPMWKPFGCCKRWMQSNGRPLQRSRRFFPGMWDGAAFRRRSMKAMRSGRKSMPNYSPCSRQMSIRKPAPVP